MADRKNVAVLKEIREYHGLLLSYRRWIEAVPGVPGLPAWLIFRRHLRENTGRWSVRFSAFLRQVRR